MGNFSLVACTILYVKTHNIASVHGYMCDNTCSNRVQDLKFLQVFHLVRNNSCLET